MHLPVESIQSRLLLFVTETCNSISFVNRFKWVADNFTIPEDLQISKIPTVGTRVSVDRTVIVTEKTESNDNSHLKTE